MAVEFSDVVSIFQNIPTSLIFFVTFRTVSLQADSDAEFMLHLISSICLRDASM